MNDIKTTMKNLSNLIFYRSIRRRPFDLTRNWVVEKLVCVQLFSIDWSKFVSNFLFFIFHTFVLGWINMCKWPVTNTVNLLKSDFLYFFWTQDKSTSCNAETSGQPVSDETPVFKRYKSGRRWFSCSKLLFQILVDLTRNSFPITWTSNLEFAHK